MLKYITDKGNELFYKVDYDLGGYSYATNKEMPRGYYLSVRRNSREFIAYQGLEHPKGAVRTFIHSVTRRSNKQEDIAQGKAREKVEEIANSYGL